MSQNILWKKSGSVVLYEDALKEMSDYARQLADKSALERVWLIEHPHTFTMGSSADSADLIDIGEVPIYETGRGGKITYHGPGQRIAYVQLDLKNYGQDIRKYVWMLEEWVIKTLQFFDVQGERREGRIGIWVVTPKGEKKIAAIGVRVQKWITQHGVAINLNPDLSYFDKIIPCGIKDFGVTSLHELGVSITMDELDLALRDCFNKVFFA